MPSNSSFSVILPILSLADIIRYRVQNEFNNQDFGITFDQWLLLELINNSNGVSQAELSDKLFRFPSSITRSIDLLMAKGLVEKMQSKESKSKNEVYLTEEGKWYLKKNAIATESIIKRLLSSTVIRDLKAIEREINEIKIEIS